MPKYVIWYRKDLEARDVLSAVRKEKKIQAQFHSLEEEKESTPQQLEPLIGFQIRDEEESY